MKHPVEICCFTDRILTSVNIPEEKFPRNSNWYADDVMQHRKYRGIILYDKLYRSVCMSFFKIVYSASGIKWNAVSSSKTSIYPTNLKLIMQI